MGKSTVRPVSILTLDDLRAEAEKRSPNFEALGLAFRSVLWLSDTERAEFEALLDGQKGEEKLDGYELSKALLILVAEDAEKATEVLSGLEYALINTLLEFYLEATQVGEA